MCKCLITFAPLFLSTRSCVTSLRMVIKVRGQKTIRTISIFLLLTMKIPREYVVKFFHLWILTWATMFGRILTFITIPSNFFFSRKEGEQFLRTAQPLQFSMLLQEFSSLSQTCLELDQAKEAWGVQKDVQRVVTCLQESVKNK